VQRRREREFYLRRTQQFGWTKNVLIHQIENRTYENTQLSQTSFDATLPEQILDRELLLVAPSDGAIMVPALFAGHSPPFLSVNIIPERSSRLRLRRAQQRRGLDRSGSF
jgi:hypothetical protein